MDKDKKSFMGHIMSKNEYDENHLKGVRVEILNGREMSVGGCRGFIEYGAERIRLALVSGTLEILGNGLVCDSYLNGAVLIRGKIKAVELSEATDEAVL